LIYTVNPTNTCSKTQWSIFSTNKKLNIITIKLNMLKFFVKMYENHVCNELFCVRNIYHHHLYRYSMMVVSIRIGWCLYRYCTDTDCIVPALLKCKSLKKLTNISVYTSLNSTLLRRWCYMDWYATIIIDLSWTYLRRHTCTTLIYYLL